MSKRSTLSHFLLGLFVGAAVLINGNGDVPFQGNRRPGILAAPTDIPTGENALLYLREAALTPHEYLDLLSEDRDALPTQDLVVDPEDEALKDPDSD